MPLDPKRTVAELKELRELTGDERRRAAGRLDRDVGTGSGVAPRARREHRRRRVDRRRRQPVVHAPGGSERAVLIGGHIDSVPNGGWLDGCLNVVAGVEVLRRIAEEGTPPVTVRLVNWADEEGARFGRSLFGSSAAAGSMADQDELRQLDGSGRNPAPRRARRARRRPRLRARRAWRSSTPRPPTSSSTSSRAPSSSRSTCRSASSSARSASSGTGSRGAARRLMRARRRWTSAATRSRARRSSRSRSATSRDGRATEPSARPAASSASRES